MSARKPREWAPKWADPGTALVWEDHEDRHLFGTVWSAGPQSGTRRVTLSDGTIALVKVGMSGRDAGTVREIVRHDPQWQGRIVRALGRLTRARALMVSDEEEWRPMAGHRDGGWTRRWVRYHVDGCQHAQRAACSAEQDVRHPNGTITYCGPSWGWHRWLLAHLAANPHLRVDLCGCITGEPVPESAAA